LCHPEHNLLSSSRRPKGGGILRRATTNPGPSAKPASGRQRPPRVRSVAWGPSSLRSSGQAIDANGKSTRSVAWGPSSLRSSGQANDTNGKASVRSPGVLRRFAPQGKRTTRTERRPFGRLLAWLTKAKMSNKITPCLRLL
jgi:hypothetical protein